MNKELTLKEVIKQINIWVNDELQDYVNLDYAIQWLKVVDDVITNNKPRKFFVDEYNDLHYRGENWLEKAIYNELDWINEDKEYNLTKEQMNKVVKRFIDGCYIWSIMNDELLKIIDDVRSEKN